MGKVLFFDIDGTLVPFRKTISPETVAALREARKNGHQVVICTGRSLYMVEEELLSEADGVISTSGSFVRCGETIVHNEFVPREVFLKIWEVMEQTDAILIGQGEHRCCYRPKDARRLRAHYESIPGGEKGLRIFFQDCLISEQPEDFAEVKKVTFRQANRKVSEIREMLRDLCEVVPSSFTDENSGEGEITCLGMNKSAGMQHYIDYLGLTREDTVAFGDNYNDTEMLEFAGIGVAMGNAVEPLKRIADYVTTNVDDNGIVHALQALGFIGNIANPKL